MPDRRRREKAVKIAAARVVPFRLCLKRALRTAHGEITLREGALLTLISDSGLEGYGEATPIEGFGLESAARCREALEGLAADRVGKSLALEEGGWKGEWMGEWKAEMQREMRDASTSFPDAPVARAALDCALHDLAAKARDLPLARLLRGGAGDELCSAVPINALVAGDTPAQVAASGAAALEAGHQIGRASCRERV